MKLKKILLTLLACFSFSGVSQAVVVLDFDSASTGSDIITNPLVTADGTITSSTVDGNLSLLDGTSQGLTGNMLSFAETTEGGYAQLAFDYNVGEIIFKYGGYYTGAFTAQVLDASFNVIDSYFDSSTGNLYEGPITLTGSDIRYFRWFDGPGGQVWATVDDMIITAATVPEPASLILLGLGLIGFGVGRKRKA